MSLDFSLEEISLHEVFTSNITHNLGKMFREAELYDILWYGDGKLSKDVIPEIEKGLLDMKNRPEHYKYFNDPNGWGKYEDAINWLEEVLLALKEHPYSVIKCDR